MYVSVDTFGLTTQHVLHIRSHTNTTTDTQTHEPEAEKRACAWRPSSLLLSRRLLSWIGRLHPGCRAEPPVATISLP